MSSLCSLDSGKNRKPCFSKNGNVWRWWSLINPQYIYIYYIYIYDSICYVPIESPWSLKKNVYLSTLKKKSVPTTNRWATFELGYHLSKPPTQSIHFEPLKMNGWETILSFWSSAYFQGRKDDFSGRVLSIHAPRSTPLQLPEAKDSHQDQSFHTGLPKHGPLEIDKQPP